jgi:hypothetical protein
MSRDTPGSERSTQKRAMGSRCRSELAPASKPQRGFWIRGGSASAAAGLAQFVRPDHPNHQDDRQDHQHDQQDDSEDRADEKERGQDAKKRQDRAERHGNSDQIRVSSHAGKLVRRPRPAHHSNRVIVDLGSHY